MGEYGACFVVLGTACVAGLIGGGVVIKCLLSPPQEGSSEERRRLVEQVELKTRELEAAQQAYDRQSNELARELAAILKEKSVPSAEDGVSLECVVCRDAEAGVVFARCKHRCLCADCYSKLWVHGAVCPLCRTINL